MPERGEPSQAGGPHTPKILDCTLRDGSYEVDFGFTTEDTRRICAALDALGIPMIEVGHGVGLGASSRGHGVAAATDVEYLQAASESVTTATWGAFCIPGIAEMSDIDMAADLGMGFIRIGCDVHDVASSLRFVERARTAGLYVFANFMKSYAVSSKTFADAAAQSVAAGTQCVYLVDSAGGMLPSEISLYTREVRNRLPEIQLGFHGHDNLGLSVANSLHCASLNYDVIDTTLQGIGRSAGNTPTERFVAGLIRSGYSVGFDPIDVMEAGEELVRPLLTTTGIDSLDTVSGLGLFHTSYMSRVLKTARQYRVDPRRLILELTSRDVVSAPEELLRECAETVAQFRSPERTRLAKRYAGSEQP